MAGVLRSRLSLAAVATAASLAIHAAVLSIALRDTGSRPEAPAAPRVVLSLAGVAPIRLAAVEPPVAAGPADDAPAAPPLSPSTESVPAAVDAVAALRPQPPASTVIAEAPADPEPPALPPAPVETPVAAEMLAAPPVPDPAASLSPAEAAPPESLASPSDPPARPAEAPVEAQPADALASPDPSITASDGRTTIAPPPPPPAPGAPAPRQVAEAAPPESFASPSDPPARPAEAPVEAQPANALASPDPSITASDGRTTIEPTPPPPAPVAPAPLQVAEAAPPAPLSDAPVAAAPTPSGEVGAVLAETAPPPAARAAPLPDAAVAALEPPPVSAERIRAFVDRYDGGPCFFASVAGTGGTGAGVETFSATVDQVMAFHAAFEGQLGAEPRVVGQRVWTAQCPAVEFLRKTRPNGPDPLRITLNSITLGDGGVESGSVSGTAGRRVALYIVSETGAVEDLSGFLQRRGEVDVFAVTIRHPRSGGPFPEMIVAVATDPSDRTEPAKPAPTLSDLMMRPFGPEASEIRSAARLILVR